MLEHDLLIVIIAYSLFIAIEESYTAARAKHAYHDSKKETPKQDCTGVNNV